MKNKLTFWAKRCALMLLLSMSTYFVKAQAPIVVEPVIVLRVTNDVFIVLKQ